MHDADLCTRLDKLEHQMKFWRTLTVLSLILCAAGAITHLEANPNWIKTTRVDATAVVAREFDLVNATGRITARLAPLPDNPDSPYLVFKYPDDKAAISIGVENQSASSISLLNSDGHPRAIVHESANGPDLSLFDEEARIRMVLDAFRTGPQISIYDKARKQTVVAFSN
jgi:hypothetical protein